MATKYQNYIAGSDAAYANWWLPTINQRLGQSFTVAVAHKIVYIKVKLYKTGDPGTIIADIYKVKAGAEYPIEGVPLCSGSYDGDSLTTDTDGEWITITLGDGYNLIVGSPYAIVLTAYNSDTDNRIYWIYDGTNSTFDNGRQLTYVGATGWGHSSSSDMMFEEWGDSPTVIDKVYSKKLIAIGNNEVWYEIAPGIMVELSDANGEINVLNPLNTAEAFQKLFIANQTNLKVADFINTKLTTTSAPTNNPNPGTILTGDSSGAKMVVDYVAPDAKTIYGKRTTVATFGAEVISGTDDGGNDIDFTTSVVETAPPHWYTWTVFGNVADADKYGTMPDSAYLVCRYRGRLVLSGNPSYPHQWYMSKIGNPFDFLYGTNDPMTAVAGTNANAGELGDIVRALIPFGDDYLIFACANSIHLLDGDPAGGGSIDELDNKTGIFGPWAWCIDGVGDLWFYGTGGLYKMVGGRSRPVNVSQAHLPQLVDNWAAVPGTHRVVLTYDPFRNGIIISRTTLADGTNLNYWYDLKIEGFYPEIYPTACGIFSSCYYDSDVAATKGLVLGCNDGYIRNFYDAVKNDDVGTTNRQISSYVTWPIEHLAEDNDREGKLTSLTVELAGGGAGGDFGDTDEVDYALYKGNDAETVLESIKDGDAAFASGTLSGTGRKARIRTRVRGAYLGLKFYNLITTTDWATATVYAVDDLVAYSNIEYICIVAHTSDVGGGDGTGGTPDGNPTDWTATSAQTWSINRVFGTVVPGGRIK